MPWGSVVRIHSFPQNLIYKRMTDLKKYFPNCNLGNGRIEVTEKDVIEINKKWKEISIKEPNKKESWEKIKNRLVR